MTATRAIMTVAAFVPPDKAVAIQQSAEEMRQRVLALRLDPEVEKALDEVGKAVAPIMARLEPEKATAVAAFAVSMLAGCAYDDVCFAAADCGPDPAAYRVAICGVVGDVLTLTVKPQAHQGTA